VCARLKASSDMHTVGQNHTFIRIYNARVVTIYALLCLTAVPFLVHARACFTCGVFSREISVHMVIYGVFIRLWPTLDM
jgi:hypothetical protein